MEKLTLKRQKELMKVSEENGYTNFSMKTNRKIFCVYGGSFDSDFLSQLNYMDYSYCVFVDNDNSGWELKLHVFAIA